LKTRIQNIYKNIEKKPDIILIKNSIEPFIDENFFYVTDLKTGVFEGAAAILYPSGYVDLLVSELEAETAKRTKANIIIFKDEKDFYKILIKKISSSKNIGINFRGITLNNFLKIEKNFPKANFLDISTSIEKARLIKDDNEIKLIKKACDITDKIVEKIPEILHDGLYEFELAAEINYLLQKNGAEKPAFETISSFGKNTAEPHYSHGNVKLKRGDIVLCDFGACYKRYNSDITRSFIFGKANEKQKKMFETVSLAQKIGIEKLSAGTTAKEVHIAVEDVINKTEYKGRFIHSTGHSLGLAVHDSTVRLSSNSEINLEENMIFTIEPGIYIPGFGGIRIEDDVLIKKKSYVILTKSPKELIEIG
jgi:Xaa-Pro dipeptidase